MEIYYIELDESYDINDNNVRVYSKCFSSYESAKLHLLEHFDAMNTNAGGEIFFLKDDHHYISEFKRDSSAEIKQIKLIK